MHHEETMPETLKQAQLEHPETTTTPPVSQIVPSKEALKKEEQKHPIIEDKHHAQIADRG